MNAEYLLDVIGCLDDDLLQEAERYRRPKVRYGRLMGLAASLAVVILLGYGVTHIRMGGMSGGAAPSFAGGGNGGAPASGNSAPGGGEDRAGVSGDSGKAFEPEAPGETAISSNDSLADTNQGASPGTIFLRGAQGSGVYILSGEILTELPGGGEPVLLGTLLALDPDAPPLCTDAAELVGLNLWAENEDILYAVYVELPEGGFARAELVEP